MGMASIVLLLNTSISRTLLIRVYFRLKTNQNERPTTYEDILVSPAIRSLQNTITDAERELVRSVIENISVASEEI
jgi:hypothetical protein